MMRFTGSQIKKIGSSLVGLFMLAGAMSDDAQAKPKNTPPPPTRGFIAETARLASTGITTGAILSNMDIKPEAKAPEATPQYKTPNLSMVIRFEHSHTNETADIDIENIEANPETLKYMLRDWRKNQQIDMDLGLMKKAVKIIKILRAPPYGYDASTISVICGFRNGATNEQLRKTPGRGGQARNSPHIKGKAFDLQIPDVPPKILNDVAWSVAIKDKKGGVGYYPYSKFVHIDTGPVRRWVEEPPKKKGKIKKQHRISETATSDLFKLASVGDLAKQEKHIYGLSKTGEKPWTTNYSFSKQVVTLAPLTPSLG